MFQVAGLTGNGVLQAACDAGIFAVGVDVDQYLSTPETAACTITSAEKKLKNSVNKAIIGIASGTAGADGTAAVGANILGIDTQDVGLAPFHEFEDLISDETRAAIAAAEAGLADGSLTACEVGRDHRVLRADAGLTDSPVSDSSKSSGPAGRSARSLRHDPIVLRDAEQGARST